MLQQKCMEMDRLKKGICSQAIKPIICSESKVSQIQFNNKAIIQQFVEYLKGNGLWDRN